MYYALTQLVVELVVQVEQVELHRPPEKVLALPGIEQMVATLTEEILVQVDPVAVAEVLEMVATVELVVIPEQVEMVVPLVNMGPVVDPVLRAKMVAQETQEQLVVLGN